ncbi:MAG: prepilin-type N-terminal cleavage/methylation domain-containing protein, partial [Planctomycetes bacterium]|nr:prepilin-type N-terminal cleavage/methylation domain-containing protein [Planctomycetota bacterium]MCG2683623.1 prepilin-type N-terminal cleavage/methylation domain-containing protein [Planctomycetales bacterium]
MKKHNHPTSYLSAANPIRTSIVGVAVVLPPRFPGAAVQLPHQRCIPVPRPPSPAPHGFTLVELLVVITIIGILVGLTIPAVMHVRVIAKQAAVTMDLKQL